MATNTASAPLEGIVILQQMVATDGLRAEATAILIARIKRTRPTGWDSDSNVFAR